MNIKIINKKGILTKKYNNSEKKLKKEVEALLGMKKKTKEFVTLLNAITDRYIKPKYKPVIEILNNKIILKLIQKDTKNYKKILSKSFIDNIDSEDECINDFLNENIKIENYNNKSNIFINNHESQMLMYESENEYILHSNNEDITEDDSSKISNKSGNENENENENESGNENENENESERESESESENENENENENTNQELEKNYDNIKVESTTEFWVHNLCEDKFNKFMDSDQNKFLSQSEENIKKNDIILLYKKIDNCNGFIGYAKVKNNLKKQIGVNFYKDNNFKHLIEINKLVIMDKILELDGIMDKIKDSTIGFKNQKSFRAKFTRYDGNFNKINDKKKGKKIFDYIKNNLTIKKIKQKIKKTKQKIKQNEKSELLLIEEETEEEIEYKNNNMVPILIITCDKFKISNKKVKSKSKYFKEHYKNCTKCEITNNNNKDLNCIFDKAKFKITEINNDNIYNEICKPALAKYHMMTYYSPNKSTNKSSPYIHILDINMDDNIYGGCLLVLWQI